MDQEPIPVEVKYVQVALTPDERIKIGGILDDPNNKQERWESIYHGIPDDLKLKMAGNEGYCPTDVVLDAWLQNKGYGLPPEVSVRMYEDFAQFLSDCGIPQDAPNYPYTALAEQFLGTRIESPMVISQVELEEPEIKERAGVVAEITDLRAQLQAGTEETAALKTQLARQQEELNWQTRKADFYSKDSGEAHRRVENLVGEVRLLRSLLAEASVQESGSSTAQERRRQPQTPYEVLKVQKTAVSSKTKCTTFS